MAREAAATLRVGARAVLRCRLHRTKDGETLSKLYKVYKLYGAVEERARSLRWNRDGIAWGAVAALTNATKFAKDTAVFVCCTDGAALLYCEVVVLDCEHGALLPRMATPSPLPPCHGHPSPPPQPSQIVRYRTAQTYPKTPVLKVGAA